MILEILEQLIFTFGDQIPDEFATPPVAIGLLGLYGYNKINEPVKDSTLKLFCVVAMIFGGVAALLIIL